MTPEPFDPEELLVLTRDTDVYWFREIDEQKFAEIVETKAGTLVKRGQLRAAFGNPPAIPVDQWKEYAKEHVRLKVWLGQLPNRGGEVLVIGSTIKLTELSDYHRNLQPPIYEGLPLTPISASDPWDSPKRHTWEICNYHETEHKGEATRHIMEMETHRKFRGGSGRRPRFNRCS
jgi:hypothetical protein